MGKRVLFLANHFITLFSFRRELIARLVEEGHDVYLSLPNDNDNVYFDKMGCKIVPTAIDRRGVNPIKDIKLIFFYKKIISEIQPDIIFSYTIKPNIYGSIASNGKCRQVCNITGTGATFLKKNIVSEICKILYKVSVKNCYKVFFQNTGDLDFFKTNGLIKNNYDILPGSGCNLAEHQYAPLAVDDVTRFIFIGRVMKLKGIDEYIEAASRVKSKFGKKVEFIIAGWNEEAEYKRIVEQYQQMGIIDYIGFRKDINEWISKCSCTVLPSHGGEGIPNVLLESAAIGRACIGSRINGTTDVIEDGVTGYLFDAGNASELEEKMVKFIELDFEEKVSMGLAGRKKVEKEFNREIVIGKYCAEIDSLTLLHNR